MQYVAHSILTPDLITCACPWTCLKVWKLEICFPAVASLLTWGCSARPSSCLLQVAAGSLEAWYSTVDSHTSLMQLLVQDAGNAGRAWRLSNNMTAVITVPGTCGYLLLSTRM